MWFVDHAKIILQAGDGGRGCSSLAQPPYTRHPYPDGGGGGDGGHVIVQADANIATLLDVHFRHEFKAGRGGQGSSNKKNAKRGEDLVIRVPAGTVIRDAKSNMVLRDLTAANEQALIATGGRGGLGNAAALEASPGIPGERRQVVLELKLIADVGIVGVPNAGKSSLLSRISTAHPKVGDYPFTTRYPVLGVVDAAGRGSFVACDIPGLIEGAHEGKGLGIQFLRHIERTRILVHVVDLAAVDGHNPVEVFHQVNQELGAYGAGLAERPQLIVANKMDLPEAQAQRQRFEQSVGGRVWPISCATKAGIPGLVQAIWKQLEAA